MDIILIIFFIFVGSILLGGFGGGIGSTDPKELEKQKAKDWQHIKWGIIINIILWTIYFLIP
ncbi:hypothetical protein OAQ02_01325 [Candidatus Marinimicrobia bacterium]|nr:hypothetical protein [Candidatus Neomarinimicrobiota bacterium]